MTKAKLNLKQVQELARQIAAEARKKDLVIGLAGTLGSGKTTFTKQFARGLNIKSITSPTFIVVAEHKLSPRRKLYHIDLYRMETSADLDHLGFTDMLQEKNRIMVIEWIDKFPRLKKHCDLIIKFQVIDSEQRYVQIHKN